MLKQFQLKDYKFRLVFYVYAISIIGILVIGSAQKSVQDKQILGLVLGTVAMLVISLVDYLWVLKFYWLIYVFNLALLLLVRIPFTSISVLGEDANGAIRWMNIGGFQFQPSELAKLLLILFFQGANYAEFTAFTRPAGQRRTGEARLPHNAFSGAEFYSG